MTDQPQTLAALAARPWRELLALLRAHDLPRRRNDTRQTIAVRLAPYLGIADPAEAAASIVVGPVLLIEAAPDHLAQLASQLGPTELRFLSPRAAVLPPSAAARVRRALAGAGLPGTVVPDLIAAPAAPEPIAAALFLVDLAALLGWPDRAIGPRLARLAAARAGLADPAITRLDRLWRRLLDTSLDGDDADASPDDGTDACSPPPAVAPGAAPMDVADRADLWAATTPGVESDALTAGADPRDPAAVDGALAVVSNRVDPPAAATPDGVSDAVAGAADPLDKTAAHVVLDDGADGVDPAITVTPNAASAHGALADLRQMLGAAIDQRRCVALTYRTAVRPVLTERVVEPYALQVFAATAYLHGYCRWRQATRVFRLDRVVAWRVLDEQYGAPPITG